MGAKIQNLSIRFSLMYLVVLALAGYYIFTHFLFTMLSCLHANHCCPFILQHEGELEKRCFPVQAG